MRVTSVNEGFSTLVFMLNNLSIFIVMVIGYGVLTEKLRGRPGPVRGLALGLFFGVIAIACMHAKIQVWDGVIVDQRNAVVALGAFFGGPVVAGISGVMTSAYRLHLGGQGAFAGVVGVTIAACMGTAFHFLQKRAATPPSPTRVAIGSAAIAVGLLPGFLFVGDIAQGWALLQKVAIPFGLAIGAGMFVGGVILAREERRQQIERDKARTEQQFKTLFETSEVAVLNLDMGALHSWVRGRDAWDGGDQPTSTAKQAQALDQQARTTRVLAGNETARELLGLGNGADFPETWARLFNGQAVPLLARFIDAMRAGKPGLRIETSLQDSTGEDRRVLLSIPVPSDGEAARTVPLTLLDITERARAEEQRDEALRDAERANEAKTEFLATMSHELRTPLNAILGFSEVLTSQYFGPTGNGAYREYGAYIHDSGKMLLDMVDDLLDIASIEAGRRTLTFDHIDLNLLVSESARMVKQAANNNELDFECTLPRELPAVRADRRAIRQVLLNLMSNAVKYTDSGGRIRVTANATDSEFVEIIVTDSGRGIPPELIDYVADPFFRRERNPHIAEEGWGLGLAVAKSLTELHHGRFTIDSRVGEGTAITVRLPYRGA